MLGRDATGGGGQRCPELLSPLVFFYKGKKMWKGCSMKRVNCRENKQYREVRESKEGGEALRKRNCRFDSGSVSTESPREP